MSVAFARIPDLEAGRERPQSNIQCGGPLRVQGQQVLLRTGLMSGRYVAERAVPERCSRGACCGMGMLSGPVDPGAATGSFGMLSSD